MLPTPAPRRPPLGLQRDVDIAIESLERLRDPSVGSQARAEAFDALLHVSAGWWGEGSLLRFAHRCACEMYASIPSVRRNCCRDELGDVASEAIVTFYRASTGFVGPPQAARPWLAGIIRMHLLKAMARDARRYRLVMLLDPNVLDRLPSPESCADQPHSRYKEIHAAIDSLTPALRTVAVMKLLRGYACGWDELSRETNLKPECLRKRWLRARDKLRHLLAPQARQYSTRISAER